MFPPAARMTNTYLAPGTDDEDEMISSIDEGFLLNVLVVATAEENSRYL